MSILSKSCPRRRDWERPQGPSLSTSMPRRLPPVAQGVPRKDASCQGNNRSNWALSLLYYYGSENDSQHGILNYLPTFLQRGPLVSQVHPFSFSSLEENHRVPPIQGHLLFYSTGALHPSLPIFISAACLCENATSLSLWKPTSCRYSMNLVWNE